MARLLPQTVLACANIKIRLHSLKASQYAKRGYSKDEIAREEKFKAKPGL